MTDSPTLIAPRCLLIAPLTFYSFHRTVAQGLERCGYHVVTLNEEFPATSLGKVLGKLALPLLRVTTLHGLKARLEGEDPFDLVLIIKGRGLGPAALRYLRTRASRIVGYNFDSFRFNPSPLDWHALTDRYATFDIVDAKSFGLPLVHLFSAGTEISKAPVPSYDASIVMRIHSDRLVYVDQVMRALEGRPVYAFLYASSRLTFLLHMLRSPGSAFRLRRYISFKPLSYERAMEAIANSRATLDYAHPLQSGITVRCFEAIGMGVPVITNNPHVARADVFAGGSVATFPLNGKRQELERVFAKFEGHVTEPEHRTTDEFIADLLAETPVAETGRE